MRSEGEYEPFHSCPIWLQVKTFKEPSAALLDLKSLTPWQSIVSNLYFLLQFFDLASSKPLTKWETYRVLPVFRHKRQGFFKRDSHRCTRPRSEFLIIKKSVRNQKLNICFWIFCSNLKIGKMLCISSNVALTLCFSLQRRSPGVFVLCGEKISPSHLI